MRPGHVLVAPDKFKGSLTAPAVAAHVAAGLARARPDVPVLTMPVADGGDGSVDAAVAAGFRRVEVEVSGPTGQPVTAAFATRGETALVEAAEASGLRRLTAGPAPLTASSHGTGELIAAALRLGMKRIVLGLGGSACTDGGAGLAESLGARLHDSGGRPLRPGGAALRELAHVDLAEFADLAGIEFVVASDVDNPLLGSAGAAAVYGPQKGAAAGDVRALEAGLARWSSLVAPELTASPGAGAAGGLGFGALALLGARIEPGIALLLELLGFNDKLPGARLVITGEGSLDLQTLHGKAPAGVARAAAVTPVIAICGRCCLSADQLGEVGIRAAFALADIEPDPRRCMTEAGPLLERLATDVAAEWL